MNPKRRRFLVLACCATLACVAPSGPVHAGALYVGATAVSPTQVSVDWTFYETPGAPAGHPEWVGYDVYRRGNTTCTEFVRLNPDIVPRVPDATHSCSWLDTPQTPNATWQYWVRPVDAARQPVALLYPACEPPCPPQAFATCPALSAPLIVGTVSDWGWAVLVESCANGCWYAGYVENPAAEALRPYAGTAQAVAVYGVMGCGTVEGCSIQLDHFTLTDCGSTPARHASWGALKTIYR